MRRVRIVHTISEGQRRCPIEFACYTGMGEHRLHFGAKDKKGIVLEIIERLSSEPIAAEIQLSFCFIEQGKSEDTVQVNEMSHPHSFIKVRNDLAIGSAAEAMIASETVSQLLVIEDFPIADQCNGLVFAE